MMSKKLQFRFGQKSLPELGDFYCLNRNADFFNDYKLLNFAV